MNGCFNPFQGFGGVSAGWLVTTSGSQQDRFQSLSGFWWGFCWRGSRYSRVVPYPRFNPFQGFGGVSAQTRNGDPMVSVQWFQSLSGFWWGFCIRCGNGPRARGTSRFNPFQGFGGVSAVVFGIRGSQRSFVSIPFRVLVGFLLLQTDIRKQTVKQVSIPFRVLVGFLPKGGPTVQMSRNGFNPFQGFGGVSAPHVEALL